MTSIAESVVLLEQQQGWESLYREIKVTSAAYELPCKAAKTQENRNRNRYRDVSPYDHSRIKLKGGPNDYINSSLVEVKEAGRQYILSQGPLPGTSGHLWQMVWEQNSKSIIMLNKVIEKGTKKCHQYWPLNEKNPMYFTEEGFMVSLKSETDNHNFIIRELELTETTKQETRIIYQFHYTAWPDFGVPESPTTFLDFLYCVRRYGVLENAVGPAIIHCSAGIGRSGTFALVDTCLLFLQKGIPFDIRETLLEMRKGRMGLIQTPQQLRFSYLAISQCEQEILSKTKEMEGECNKECKSDIDKDETSDELHDDERGVEEDDEPKESRKRCAEKQNGPTDEKRGKEVVGQEETVSPTENNNVRIDQAVRHRKISEKKEALKNHVEQIKNNMKVSEEKCTHTPWKRYIIGGFVTTIVIGIAFRFWYS